ncbi:ketopantoate reductase family protein [Halalkalibacter alkalisediminis]|uniref:2-dehydropantoate 2-reductase n=1 Tax=Halalkalibacter alkalisediminis TaxID=935616 RepID=A0ABV6NJ31_9BACI|nr:ketopantoate reductase family protein [Halalkalibacter alkalisediminis]
MIRKVSLIGLGGIGAAYASRLHKMDPTCLQVIANEERIHRYQEHGVTVNGERYDFNYKTPFDETEPADLLLISVKYDGLDQALEGVQNHVGQNTIIMSLMNGIASEDIIAEQFGSDQILHAMCVAIDALRTGTSITFTNIGRICFGDTKNATVSQKIDSVKELFDRASVPYEVPEDILHSMWWKFMINVGVNQTSAILNAPYKVFQQIPESRELMSSAMKEVVHLAQKKGIQLSKGDLNKFEKILLEDLSPEGKTSMLQDIEAGRKTEVDYLAGTVSKLGQELQVPTPINDMFYQIIKVIEKKNIHFS